jgi:hypothetical protein
MIAVYINTPAWRGKVNFIDDQNMVVGYDTAQQCCEDATWCVSESLPTSAKDFGRGTPHGFDWDDYRFDPDTQPVEFHPEEKPDDDYDPSPDTHAVAFRMTSKWEPDAWLILHNTHNGYYSHGWDRKGPDSTHQNGYI